VVGPCVGSDYAAKAAARSFVTSVHVALNPESASGFLMP
jgi:hypothetical protein